MSEQWTHTLSSFQEEYALPYNTLRFIAQLLWNGECRDEKGDVNALFHWCKVRHIEIEELNEFVVQNTADVESGALAKEILASNSTVRTLKEMISQAKKRKPSTPMEKVEKRREAIALLIETPEEAKKKAEKKAKGKKNQKKKRATKQKKQDRNALSRDKSRGRPKTKQDNKGKK